MIGMTRMKMTNPLSLNIEFRRSLGSGGFSVGKPLIFLLAGASLASAISPIGLLPDDKVAIVVTEGERNPFGKTSPKAAAAVADNEETRIRSVIDHLPIAGVIESRSGKRILLGPHMIEEGKTLPPLVANQKEKVQVVSISEGKIELAFLESNGEVGTRRIVVQDSLAPEVNFRVAPRQGPAGGKFDGVISKDEMGASR